MADQEDIGYLLDVIELDYEVTALRVRARRCLDELESIHRRLSVLRRVMDEKDRRNGEQPHEAEE